tara:strand:+ start:2359 stop:3075 length:717 start_codon:yes stop_codon:yes gene_type:complete
MEEFLLQAPVPGQSLTDEPKNFPWERPADITDQNEALTYHLERMNRPEVLDDLYSLIELDFPLYSLAETMLSVAVMDGIHTIDISLALAPVVYQQLVQMAEEANLPYKTGLEEDDVIKTEKQQDKIEALIRKEINNMSDDPDESVDFLGDVLESLEGSTPNYEDAMNIQDLENVDRTRELNPGFDSSPPMFNEEENDLRPNVDETAPPEEGGPFNPFPLGSDENPIMAGKGLMSRGAA